MIKQVIESVENELHHWFDKLPKGIIDGFNFYSNDLIHNTGLFLSGLKKKSIAIDDIKVSYLEGGNPKNETLLMLHGFADNKYTYLLTAGQLTKKYHVIIPDLPGFGESSKPIDATYTFEQFSEWILTFLNHLEISKVHAIGNSLGGAICAIMATTAVDTFSSCIFINSAGITSQPTSGAYKLLEQGINIFELNNLAQFNDFLNMLFAKPPFLPFFIKHYRLKKFIANKSWYHKVMNDMSHGMLDGDNKELSIKENRALLDGKLEKINIPTLILWGDSDKIFEPNIANIFHGKILNSQMKILKNTGHMPQVESPNKVAKELKKFLESIK